MSTHSPHIAAVCCLSSFSVFLPISLARVTGDTDTVLQCISQPWVMSSFMLATCILDRQLAQEAVPPSRCLRRRCPSQRPRDEVELLRGDKERPSWSGRAAIVIILIVPCY